MHSAYQLMGDAAEDIKDLMLYLFEICHDVGGNALELLLRHAELLAEWNSLVEICITDEVLAEIAWDCREPLLFDLPVEGQEP